MDAVKQEAGAHEAGWREKELDPLAEIKATLESNRFAVLATESEGQPHTSLVGISAVDDLWTLAFATFRSTRKYLNLLVNGRVSLLIGDRSAVLPGRDHHFLLTAHGLASEAPTNERSRRAHEHTKHHPELIELLSSPDSALFLVAISAYQTVSGIEDVRWYPRPASAAG